MSNVIEQLRKKISDLLVERAQPAEFSDTESLFDSGLLDSVAAVNFLMELENVCDVDLTDPDFDLSKIDTFEELKSLLSETEET
ncbi:phosphopantetheine-binding protein [Lentilitoribacter sp. EG35]|jgi:acyl carrier protein|uniref:phosphopantetheine-binding protein n=1 Tax=Lentilitoribacter sp. EG35 TaxID=3234192 RepID=UPI0034609874